MLTRKMIVGMIMMVLVSMSGVGWAAEYWVHPDGNDSNLGTEASPFRTIKHAVSQCTSDENDIMHVQDDPAEEPDYVEPQVNINISKLEIIFENGVTVEGIAAGQYCLFRAQEYSNRDVKNITLRGEETGEPKAKLSLQKGAHVIWLEGCENVKISNLTLEGADEPYYDPVKQKWHYGDGILVNPGIIGHAPPYCKNIEVNNVTCDNNLRNAISVVGVDGLTIKSCVLKNTSGAPSPGPWAGIDIEPDYYWHILKDIEIQNTTMENNAGYGIDLMFCNVEDLAESLDITIEDVYVTGGDKNGNGIRVSYMGENVLRGSILFRNVTVENTNIGTQINKSRQGAPLTFKNCVWKNQSGSKPPIWFWTHEDINLPGGVNFINCQVFDDKDRVAIGYYTWNKPLSEVDGHLYVKNVHPNRADLEDDPNDLFFFQGGKPDLTVYSDFCQAFNRTRQKWYSSIQSAINDSANGDVIEVMPCTHYETIDFGGKAITLRGGDPGDWDVVAATVIDAGGASRGVKFTSGEGGDSVLTGLTVRNAEYGIRCEYSSPTISNCIVESCTVHGMYCGGGSPTISNCIARENCIGLSFASSSATVNGCEAKQNSMQGIFCYGIPSPTVMRNRIVGNGSGYSGITLSESGAIVKSNWIYNNYDGVRCFNSSSAVVRNNTIVGSTRYGIWRMAGTAPPISNFILWDNDDDLHGCSATYSCIKDGDPGTGNISSDPKFVDLINDDYHLSSSSPCIDAGDPYGTYTGELDIDGESRVIDGDGDQIDVVDMGADEYCRVHNTTQDSWYYYIQDAIDNASDGVPAMNLRPR